MIAPTAHKKAGQAVAEQLCPHDRHTGDSSGCFVAADCVDVTSPFAPMEQQARGDKSNNEDDDRKYVFAERQGLEQRRDGVIVLGTVIG